MINGRKSPDGALFITETPPPNIYFMGGMAIGTQGAIYARSDLPPQVYANGFALRESGALCIRYGFNLANAIWQQGLPFDPTGHLCCQLNQPVSPGDSYVGGVRVGPLGGVYVIDTTPPPEGGYSTGFSDGFDTV